VGVAYAGQFVTVLLRAASRSFEIWWDGRLLKKVPIKGLVGEAMPLNAFVAFMRTQAVAEERKARQHVVTRRLFPSA